MSAAVLRAFDLVWALQGQSLNGLRLKSLADAVSQQEPTTLRDLNALADAGVAERVPKAPDCWRLSPRLVQVAIAHQSEVARQTQELSDFANRYTRLPN